VQYVVNGCAKENAVINFQHILYHRAAVNLVIGIFSVSCATAPCRVARCPVFDRTVRFFGDLSDQKYYAKPDN